MKILFYKADFAWPRASGHDVHTYYVMRSLVALGARVGLVTRRPPPAEAIAGLPLDFLATLQEGDCIPTAPVRYLEERFRSYWGTPKAHVAGFASAAKEFGAEAVVVSGLDVLPMLSGVEGAVRVWYAADEWVWHHLSQVRPSDRRSWGNLRDAAVKGVYERAYRHRVDRVWVVSEPDRRAFRWLAGMPHADVLANGVDAELYKPTEIATSPETAVFWGRLDFGPNVQAAEWFCHRIWPALVAERPGARFTILGFNPGREVQELAKLPGVEVKPNLEDIKPEVARHAVVVLPFTSGGGIKNKLLEAAAMGKAVVCTPRALNGVRGRPPVQVARAPEDWAAAVKRLWDDAPGRESLAGAARAWVVQEHTWEAAARLGLAGLEEARRARKSA